MLPHLIDDLASVLAEPDTNVLRQVFRAHESEIRARSADVRRAHDGVRDALDKEPFEQSALLAALDEAKARDAALAPGDAGGAGRDRNEDLARGAPQARLLGADAALGGAIP